MLEVRRPGSVGQGDSVEGNHSGERPVSWAEVYMRGLSWEDRENRKFTC